MRICRSISKPSLSASFFVLALWAGAASAGAPLFFTTPSKPAPAAPAANPLGPVILEVCAVWHGEGKFTRRIDRTCRKYTLSSAPAARKSTLKVGNGAPSSANSVNVTLTRDDSKRASGAYPSANYSVRFVRPTKDANASAADYEGSVSMVAPVNQEFKFEEMSVRLSRE